MTIDEMHIAVQQDLQKIDSYANANVEAEEIDFHLNRFTRNFVDDVIGKLNANPITPTEFQANQRLLGTIQTLQVKNHKLPVTVEDSDNHLVGAALPSNYRHLLADASELIHQRNVDKTKLGVVSYIYPFSFLADNVPINGLELEIEGGVVFRLSDYDYYSDGVTGETKYQLVNLILDNVKDLYWENYNGETFRNRFIFVSDGLRSVKYTLNDVPVTITPIFKNVIKYRYFDTDVIIRNGNRLNKDGGLDFARNHPYEKTTWESPISSMANNRLYVYEDRNFRIKNLVIDYIRRPITISKAMAVNSDLPEDTQERILEQTIIHLKGIIQDPSWQTAVQQNQLNNK